MCSPHTRGDGPESYLLVFYDPSSPHTRGDGPAGTDVLWFRLS